MRTPYEHRQPITKAKADAFNKFYWIGRWFDACRELKIAEGKAGMATMFGHAAEAEVWIAKSAQLRDEAAQAKQNAEHFGALLPT